MCGEAGKRDVCQQTLALMIMVMMVMIMVVLMMMIMVVIMVMLTMMFQCVEKLGKGCLSETDIETYDNGGDSGDDDDDDDDDDNDSMSHHFSNNYTGFRFKHALTTNLQHLLFDTLMVLCLSISLQGWIYINRPDRSDQAMTGFSGFHVGN